MKGNIEVQLPKEAKEITLQYSKVEGAKQPDRNMEYEYVVTVDEQNIGKLTDLDVGTYQIQAFADGGYEFMPSIVSVPMWNEEEKEMQYDITVLPKYSVHTQPPITGDKGSGMIYGILGTLSMIIVVIISCHNRLKCGRMSHMYSKRRRI